jgi:D-sedoheptulose 7-phosphate isomerase
MIQHIEQVFTDHIKTTALAQQTLIGAIDKVCEIVTNCIKTGNKVLLFGNGGSAADAQHIAAEFTGRFLKDRRSLAAIALTTDTSALTSIGNDYGFDYIFERQVNGLANKNDVLIGISTSGNSLNILKGLEAGQLLGCITIGLSGRDGGLMNRCCDVNIVVPSDVTARIQEVHILIGHIICEAVDMNAQS